MGKPLNFASVNLIAKYISTIAAYVKPGMLIIPQSKISGKIKKYAEWIATTNCHSERVPALVC